MCKTRRFGDFNMVQGIRGEAGSGASYSRVARRILDANSPLKPIDLFVEGKVQGPQAAGTGSDHPVNGSVVITLCGWNRDGK